MERPRKKKQKNRTNGQQGHTSKCDDARCTVRRILHMRDQVTGAPELEQSWASRCQDFNGGPPGVWPWEKIGYDVSLVVLKGAMV